MKRKERVSQLHKLSLVDLKSEISSLESDLHAKKTAISFGKAKDVRTLRNLRRDLARSLTIARQQLTNVHTVTSGEEK